MMVVPDINDVFLPISEDSLFVSPHEARLESFTNRRSLLRKI